MAYRLVAFDMDGTLTRSHSSWVRLHRHFGTLHVGDANLAAYAARRITYEEFMRRDIAAWLAVRPRIHRAELERVLGRFRLSAGAARVAGELRSRGCATAIISSGVDIQAERVAAALGIEHVRANGIATNQRGHLTGEGIYAVDPRRKDAVLRALCRKLSIRSGESVAVGDSSYDRSFLEGAGLGVAYRSEDGLAEHADVEVERLDEILDYVK